jgi:nitrogen regulatory protein P-II 2
MKTVPLKLVTIVAEAVLEDRLVRDLGAAGARGHTVTTVRGHGSRGVRASDWEGGNVRIEVIVSDEVSGRVLDLLAERYFPNYAVVAWVENVQVVRGEKYV